MWNRKSHTDQTISLHRGLLSETETLCCRTRELVLIECQVCSEMHFSLQGSSTEIKRGTDNSLVMCRVSHTNAHASFSSGHLSKTVLLESIAMVMNDVTMGKHDWQVHSVYISVSQHCSKIALLTRLFFCNMLLFLPFHWFTEHFCEVILKIWVGVFVVSEMCWERQWTQGSVGKRDCKTPDVLFGPDFVGL